MPAVIAKTMMFAAALACAAGAAAAASPEEHVDRQTQAAMALDAHPERGAQKFGQYCARCHGVDALGNSRLQTPALAAQRYAYLVRQLANFAGTVRDSAAMHAVVSNAELREPQMWADIAGYLNSKPNAAPISRGPGGDVPLGRGIFQQECASCHGLDAGGDDDGFVPSLRHQRFEYLKSQMHKLGEGSRHNVDPNLVLFLRGFEDREVDATADYLSRMTGPRQERKKMRANGVVAD